MQQYGQYDRYLEGTPYDGTPEAILKCSRHDKDPATGQRTVPQSDECGKCEVFLVTAVVVVGF
jgi:hypothetical protein